MVEIQVNGKWISYEAYRAKKEADEELAEMLEDLKDEEAQAYASGGHL